ncbi:hypothetical protein Pst134EA_032454, partial [Puccinia striiformis f. sp. tritici]|uniref:uncharacterized protein n=1 Tax=Puccinia striiformis f. sp. tritici TaxID=168172 RepID=UPI002007CD60
MVFGFFETHWSFDQIPDLTVWRQGIKSKAEEAIIKIKEELTKSKKEGEGESDREPFIEFLEFDLSKLSSGKSTAEEFLKKEDRLDMLINNAGIVSPLPIQKIEKERRTERSGCVCEHRWRRHELSPDGIELQACNGIGHYGLTIPLLDILKKTDKEEGSQVRIVNLASIAHKAAAFNPDFSSLETLNQS